MERNLLLFTSSTPIIMALFSEKKNDHIIPIQHSTEEKKMFGCLLSLLFNRRKTWIKMKIFFFFFLFSPGENYFRNIYIWITCFPSFNQFLDTHYVEVEAIPWSAECKFFFLFFLLLPLLLFMVKCGFETKLHLSGFFPNKNIEDAKIRVLIFCSNPTTTT